MEYYYTYRSFNRQFNRDVKLVMLEEGAVIQSVQESVVGHAHAAGKQTWWYCRMVRIQSWKMMIINLGDVYQRRLHLYTKDLNFI